MKSHKRIRRAKRDFAHLVQLELLSIFVPGYRIMVKVDIVCFLATLLIVSIIGKFDPFVSVKIHECTVGVFVGIQGGKE